MAKKKILIIGENISLDSLKNLLEAKGANADLMDNNFEKLLTKQNLEQYDEIIIDIVPFTSIKHLDFLGDDELRFSSDLRRWHEYGLHFVLYIRKKLGFNENKFKIFLKSHIDFADLHPISVSYEHWLKSDQNYMSIIDEILR